MPLQQVSEDHPAAAKRNPIGVLLALTAVLAGGIGAGCKAAAPVAPTPANDGHTRQAIQQEAPQHDINTATATGKGSMVITGDNKNVTINADGGDMDLDLSPSGHKKGGVIAPQVSGDSDGVTINYNGDFGDVSTEGVSGNNKVTVNGHTLQNGLKHQPKLK